MRTTNATVFLYPAAYEELAELAYEHYYESGAYREHTIFDEDYIYLYILNYETNGRDFEVRS